MTRINLVPPKELNTRHLFAEYRELPRVFALAAKWSKRGKKEAIPKEYDLGKGHVTFFYDKLAFLAIRQKGIIDELVRRGHHPNFNDVSQLLSAAPKELYNNWEPTKREIKRSRARIQKRLDEMSI